LSVPLEVVWLELGYTPAQIQDMKTLAGLPDRPAPGSLATPTFTPAAPAVKTTQPGV
jgi:hypothetical protein